MPMFEILFRVSHDCPFGNISRRFPDLKMFQWCNREHEVIELKVNSPDEYSKVLQEVSEIAELIHSASDEGRVHLVTRMCQCSRFKTVSTVIDKFNLLQVLPVVYEQGWEYYRIMAFRHEEIEELLKDLKSQEMTVEVIRKVPFDGFVASSLSLTAGAVLSELTEKQMDALVTAFVHGYYERPRRANVQTIATKTRVPRSTFQEHLRKAEKKLVNALIPHIQLYRTQATQAESAS
ncbi:MAG: helix-turn-helix domain-containing protein [Candidatus Thorarchaeota archaeon]|nr:MAG: helix-turn-helix domain-containing protein [Candidatus Thorarchaeota archaeon]